MKLRFISILILSLLCIKTNAQSKLDSIFVKGKSDSLYYDELKSMVTVRLFSATKFSDFTLNDDNIDLELNYKSNQTQSIGVGASYKGLSLNLGYGFSFNNQDDSLYGHTKRIDFLTQIYTRKFAINIYSSVYRGFYLDNSKTVINNWPKEKYYTRPDITGSTFGASASYYLNHERFSNRATFVQTEWQKKSAGSFILGFSAIYNQMKADSSFVPENIIDDEFFGNYHYIKSNYLTFGSYFGYAYTLVVMKRLFFTAGLNVGFLVGNNTTFDDQNESKSVSKLNFTILPNLGLGYNSKRFYAGFSYSSMTSVTPTPIEKTNQSVTNGKYQFVYAYRFKVREDLRILPKSWPIDF